MSRTPGHHALRIGRHSQQGGIYLITLATVERRRLFADFTAACAACRTFEPSCASESATLLCWVLMPDHFHGLVRLDGSRSLSQVVQRIKSISSHACADMRGALPVWSRAFHDHALRQDEDLMTAARYVIANPIQAKLVRRVREYPFWNAVWL